jgi:hypothetical protein
MFLGCIDALQMTSFAAECTGRRAQRVQRGAQFWLDRLLSTIDWQMSPCDRRLLAYRID